MVAFATSALLSSQGISWLEPLFSKKINTNVIKFVAIFHGLIRPVAVCIAVCIDNLVFADPFWAFVSCTIIAPHPKKATIVVETAPRKKSWLFFNVGKYLASSFARRSIATSLALHPVLHATASSS